MNLTGRAYALAVFIVAMGIIEQWTTRAGDYWRLPAAAVLILLVYEGVSARRRRFSLERLLPAASALGVETNGKLVLTNLGAFPLEVLAFDEAPDGADLPSQTHAFAVAPGEQQADSFTFLPHRLGTVRWDQVRMRVKGHLGLAWWSRKVAVPSHTNVIPDRLADTERRRSGTFSGGDLNRPRPGGGLDLLGLREYRPGDPVNTIDWKATARSGQPVVRVMSQEQHLELVLVVDVGRTSGMAAGDLSRLGHYTNIAARLSEKALGNGDRVHLITFADRVLHTKVGLRGQSGLLAARRMLEQVRTRPEHSNPLPAIMRVRQLIRRRSLVVMLSDLDEGDAAAQLVDAMTLLRPTHLPVVAGIMDQEVLSMADGPARKWLDPYYALAAREVVENWRHIAYRLRRLGAHVVLAPPDRIDNDVLGTYERLREQRRV